MTVWIKKPVAGDKRDKVIRTINRVTYIDDYGRSSIKIGYYVDGGEYTEEIIDADTYNIGVLPEKGE